MAKIRKEVFQIAANHVAKYHDLTIYYDKGLFYIEIPEDYYEACASMTEDQYSEMNIKKRFSKGNTNAASANFIWIIFAETETVLEYKIRVQLKKLAEMTKVTRQVIIVYFSTKSKYSNEERRTNENNDFQRLEFALLYCTETTINAGVPSYTHTEHGYSMNTGANWRGESENIILDDTPENRIFLEDMHSRFAILIDKMKGFFGDGETLLQLISSNQKLLG